MNFLNIKKENDLCWVYLNRPDAMNALNNELLRELTEFNNNLKNDLDTKVVIYSGEERIFLLELILKRASHLDQVLKLGART